MKALIADDDVLMRRLIIRVLNGLGVSDIVEAADGKEALALFEQNKLDLLILDWHMPRMSGLNVVKEIRRRNSEVPIVMVTAESEKEQIVEALQAGTSDYLIKPFEHNALKEKLTRWCTTVTATP